MPSDQDRVENPDFQPHWAEMLARLDEAEASFGAYRATDGHMSFATPDSRMVTNLIQEFRHVIRYAQDAEQGSERLRQPVAAYELEETPIRSIRYVDAAHYGQPVEEDKS